MKNITLTLFIAVLVTLFSVESYAKPPHHGHGHKHAHKHGYKHGHKKGHKKVVVVKKHRPSPKKRPKHKYYHYKKMPRHTTYIKIGKFTYAQVGGHYYQRRGDRYVNVIIK